ncbi:MAG TPA: cell division protein FtsL [Desulfobacteraceae bacterium]|nr:cell division protein FtsL [Desulfobacteraceae bacterium]
MTRKDIVSNMKGSRNVETGVGPRNTRIKSARMKLTARQMLIVVATVIIFMTCSIGYVWSNFEGTQLGYSISRLKSEERQLLNRNKQLKVELAYLKSSERLERIALEKLGMKWPSRDQIVVLP